MISSQGETAGLVLDLAVGIAVGIITELRPLFTKMDVLCLATLRGKSTRLGILPTYKNPPGA